MVRLHSRPHFGKQPMRLPSTRSLATSGRWREDDPPCHYKSYCRTDDGFEDLKDVARRTGGAALSQKDHTDLIGAVIMGVEDWGSSDGIHLGVEELVVISLLLAGPLKWRQVRKWILKLFAHYHQHPDCGPYHAVRSLLDRTLLDVLSDYHLPITTADAYELLDIEANAARLYLRDIFVNQALVESPKASLFLTLPAELRIMIYKYVLGLPGDRVELYYPSSGVKIAHLFTIGRDPDSTAGSSISEYLEEDRLLVGPLRRLLAFSRVNKQLYDEVSKVFFDSYKLYFDSARTLHRFAMAPIGRFNSMTRIAFPLSIEDINVAASVLKRLAQLPNLRYINMLMTDEKWEDLMAGKRLRSGRVVSRDNSGTFHALRRLTITNGKKVFFEGGAPKVEKFLETL